MVEGDRAPATIVRSWTDAEPDVSRSGLEVQRSGRQKGGLETLGWTGVTQTFRPFLSYNELGSMLDDGPSKLYDALSTVLGLEDLVAAQELLRRTRLGRTSELKEVTGQLAGLRGQLAACDDPRAQACLIALKGKAWDLEAVEAQVISAPKDPAAGGELARLERAASCPSPSLDAVSQAATELIAAAQGAAAVAGTESARALDRAELLEQALRFHVGQSHQDGEADCPVCGTPAVLGPAWRARSEEEIRTLRAEAKAADAARQRLRRSRQAALALVTPVPPSVSDVTGLGMDAEAAATLEAWRTWASATSADEPEELARLLVERATTLGAAVQALRTAAQTEIARRQDAWRPVATALAEWVGPARRVRARAAAIPAITAAEDWVKTASAAIRQERFDPIASKATAIWQELRGQSNVALESISLGAYPQRKVTLGVTVDGVAGAALGVMSQGELHALALSLFLPRASLAGSPFHFIVIDDPVQSMDPARVEGLARVLEETAKTRQVIVFTHDDRLPEACRRLQVGAEMIEVHRRHDSVVELARVSGPIERYLDDAHAIASTTELTEAITTRVAGVFCRLALEAACTEAVLRRRLGRGEAHADVAALLAGAEKLIVKAALALFDDPSRAADVLPRLARFGPWAPDAFKAANKGSHQALSVATLRNLIDNTGRLAQQLGMAA